MSCDAIEAVARRNETDRSPFHFVRRLADNLPAHATALKDESQSIFEVLKSGVVLCEYVFHCTEQSES